MTRIHISLCSYPIATHRSRVSNFLKFIIIITVSETSRAFAIEKDVNAVARNYENIGDIIIHIQALMINILALLIQNIPHLKKLLFLQTINFCSGIEVKETYSDLSLCAAYENFLGSLAYLCIAGTVTICYTFWSCFISKRFKSFFRLLFNKCSMCHKSFWNFMYERYIQDRYISCLFIGLCVSCSMVKLIL